MQYLVESLDVIVHDAGWTDGDEPVAELCTSSCGDGVCDWREDCSSCAADCGCTGTDTCGGSGTPGVCGCAPITECPEGYQCGTIDDGCGGTLDCATGPRTRAASTVAATDGDRSSRAIHAVSRSAW